MARRSKKALVQNESWESNKGANQKFTKICNDMIESKAWQAIGIEGQGLYVLLKSKYTKRSDGSNNALDIHITKKDYKVLGKSKNTIMKYLDRLIECGFIQVTQHGKYSRTNNVYGFSDLWKQYGTKEFFIHPNTKRLTKTNTSDALK